jgi:hypothetical protein
MTTVTSKATGRKYEVRHTLYGTSNNVYSLYYGGIWLASTEQSCNNSDGTLETAIINADARVAKLGINVTD